MRLSVFLLAAALASGQGPGPATDPSYEPRAKGYEALGEKKFDEAIGFFLKSIELAPSRAAVRKDLAYTYLKTGQPEAARDQFAEAMRLDPKDLHVALEYAFLCNDTRQVAKARRVFDRIRHWACLIKARCKRDNSVATDSAIRWFNSYDSTKTCGLPH